jgi:hypothetical protein
LSRAAVPGGGPAGPGWLTGGHGLAGVPGLDPSGATGPISTPGLADGLAKNLGHRLGEWVLSGTASLVEACGRAIEATTAPSLGMAFEGELRVLERLGALLTLGFLLVALIQAILRQDLGGLLRAVLLRLPFAVIAGAGAAGLVALALRATDEMSQALMGSSLLPIGALVGHLAGLLAGQRSPSVLDAGFAGALVALVVAAVSLLLWLELVVRSSAIVVATLFLPLALAGVVWQESLHFAKRLGELLSALVLSKLVVVAILVLAARTVADANGLDGLVQGGALLGLAAVSPFSLLRLVPMVEAGALGHLEGVGRKAARASAGLALGVGSTLRARASERAAEAGAGIPFAEGVPFDHASLAAMFEPLSPDDVSAREQEP